jgi:cyclase|tara:strand:- start:5897 stop:6652 length:756 start_codon:yes stop_codon:yes gene_type:complete
MNKVRIIPKLEIKNSHLIKGLQYEGLRKVGDPIDFAKKYYEDGADQINIIDIVSSLYTRDNLYEIIDKITDNIFIPICVGGGIKKIENIVKLLDCGADRVIINSEAFRNKEFINDIGNIFGKQFISISIEAKKFNNEYYCMMDHGRENTNIKVNEWVKYINKLGVGEIIINSVDNDGMESGFDLSLIRLLDNNTKCPIVISGGAGNFNHFLEATKFDYISGLSASSVFHFNKINILDLKKSLKDNKVNTVE